MTEPIDTNEMRRKVGPSDYDGHDVFALCDEIDRLRGVQTPTHGKTVRVKVAVAVDKTGTWSAVGHFNYRDEYAAGEARDGASRSAHIYWLTATLPVPQEVEVVAEVEK